MDIIGLLTAEALIEKPAHELFGKLPASQGITLLPSVPVRFLERILLRLLKVHYQLLIGVWKSRVRTIMVRLRILSFEMIPGKQLKHFGSV